MKKLVALSGVIVLAAGIYWLQYDRPRYITDDYPIKDHLSQGERPPKPPGKRPGDWFHVQRAWPHDTLSVEKQLVATEFSRQALAAFALKASESSAWQQAGPTNIPGRITAIDVHPSDLATVYAGSAAGGVFKSTDSGVTWSPIFDDVGSPAIGAIAIDPSDPATVYVGTGEANQGADNYPGTGIYKSIDAGLTWSHLGLTESRHIGRIIVDPSNSQRIFVAAGGRHFGDGNPVRGVYRSDDGGATWLQKLYISDITSCIDIVYNHNDGTVLAAMWDKVRYIDQPTILGGPNTGVYRSSNFGDTWAPAGGGIPGPSDTLGRIGLTMAQASNVVYAMFSNRSGEFVSLWKSVNNGATWTRVNDGDLLAAPLNASWAGGWYFGQVRVAPSDPDLVFATGLDIWRSNDGGATWFWTSGNIHVDQHAVWIDPNNPNRVYSGGDGGVNYSTSAGNSWAVRLNQPSTQFYAIEIDPSDPNRLYGGTQDNGTLRTLTGNIDDWTGILGGDGFYVIVDPTDPDVIYAEAQNGYLYKSTDGGFNWGWALSSINYNNYRHNWSTPIAMDPNDNLVIYYGTNHLLRSIDGAGTFVEISGDLTNGPHPRGNFGTITTIAVAPSNSSVVYVGTDDGNVWVSQNVGAGNTWTRLDASLPDRWVTRVNVDPHHANIAYVTFSGFWDGEPQPHIFRTENYGANWTDIGTGLPDSPINDVIPDPEDSLTLFIGTDYGVFTTINLGASWAPLGTGLPVIPVHDLAFDPGTRLLAAGTHGRSMFTIDLGGCCTGQSGNVNDNIAGTVDLSDLIYLVNALFQGGPLPPCSAAANVNGDSNCDIDLSDLVFLVNYLFMGGPAPMPCIAGC
ncbi:MAG: glycosyl hydrolase [candidate division Zixibacteria bacterium]|jgi:hypothetical protein|nr:glycosyl hydrolase [candidate division Zixibacteria bacterium]